MMTDTNPRRTGLTIITIAFGMFTFAHWGVVAGQFLGQMSEPSGLVVLHFISGAAAYTAMFGSWRRRQWAWIAAIVWGGAAAALIWAVGPLVGLSQDERRGLTGGAISAMMIGGGLGLYLRSALARRA